MLYDHKKKSGHRSKKEERLRTSTKKEKRIVHSTFSSIVSSVVSSIVNSNVSSTADSIVNSITN